MAPADNKKTVVVVGLGYAGVKIASKLDGVANVIAIDRHTHHFHAPAGPLAIVDAAYTERVRTSPTCPEFTRAARTYVLTHFFP